MYWKYKIVKKKLKCRLKVRKEIVTKPKYLNCDKAQQLLFLQDPQTLIETKLKKSRFWEEEKKLKV